jgi:hypothetical protein
MMEHGEGYQSDFDHPYKLPFGETGLIFNI